VVAHGSSTIRLRVGVRESCIRAGAGARHKGQITVALPPFDVEFLPDGAMDFRFGRAFVQHPGDESAPLVNLCLCAFDVGALLAASNYWLLGWFRICHKSDDFRFL